MKIKNYSLLLLTLLPLYAHASSEFDELIKDTTSGKHDPLNEDFIASGARMYRFYFNGKDEYFEIHSGGAVGYTNGEGEVVYGNVKSCPRADDILFPQYCFDMIYDALLERNAAPLIAQARHLGIEDESAYALAHVQFPTRPEEEDINKLPNPYGGIKKSQYLCALAEKRLRDHGISFTFEHLTKAKPPCTLKPLG